ncbi:MAG: type III pantothenate kinase [Betaproteobacteria bacterium]|nr:type III pantothenate kinase [Betaproteobacteria bacterium]MDE2131953.1 type III pantothenate kinase [Betaproteobacteria bacterium]MDE2211716.1 type III pantothenate kinase [Betaproteobacteria bacterium]MDE2353405.1 type III pantothenate kinase [Betaproteobacteria bacterium]
MRLALDIGNSRIKWGLRQNHRWHSQGALPTIEWPRIEALLHDHQEVTEVWACHVAEASVAAGIEAACAAAQIPLRWVESASSAGGIVNRYDKPGQLGTDRWVALIGARARTTHPVIVVNAGTATTIDALSSTGEFLGGMILPGLTLMRQALHRGTAALPSEPSGCFAPFPRNTADAIVTGSIAATVGAIESLAQTLTAHESSEVHRLLSGGHAETLQPHVKMPADRVTYLVLEGLARLMEN